VTQQRLDEMLEVRCRQHTWQAERALQLLKEYFFFSQCGTKRPIKFVRN
jgi:hypothetical protein